MKQPVVDLSVCIYCGMCAEISPSVFLLNDAGYVEVADLPEYPEEEVAEAIKYCPVDCIYKDEEEEAAKTRRSGYDPSNIGSRERNRTRTR